MTFVRKLTKIEVERMLDAYDHDPVGTLTLAISQTNETHSKEWAELVTELGYDPAHTQSLLDGRLDALDQLLKRLVENRSL